MGHYGSTKEGNYFSLNWGRGAERSGGSVEAWEPNSSQEKKPDSIQADFRVWTRHIKQQHTLKKIQVTQSSWTAWYALRRLKAREVSRGQDHKKALCVMLRSWDFSEMTMENREAREKYPISERSCFFTEREYRLALNFK